jgi:hypothetical protein
MNNYLKGMELLIQIKLGEKMAERVIVTVLQLGCQLEVSDRFVEFILHTQIEYSTKFEALILTI